MGVPGNGNNLSHGTSPQVPSTGQKTSVDHTRELAQVPQAVATRSRPPRSSHSQTEGGSGATPPRTTPKAGKQPHKGEGIMLNMLES
ncbi:hypothetical protein Taro_021980 [Colocasia esculenta]|uniref:Uncharacterized protein n=1 Tax=Colocasia esculenta TaxID=4460 RepID=A0A843V6Z5_COLES|nr:hypothetical protein [Colocasia esculenta]